MCKSLRATELLTLGLWLQDTHRTLVPAQQAATSGHAILLKQKMLTAILRRLDSVLFDKLTRGTPPAACKPCSNVAHMLLLCTPAHASLV